MVQQQHEIQKSTIDRFVLIRAITQILSRVAPVAASRLAETLFLYTGRRHKPPREQDWATTAHRCYIPTETGSLPAWQWGEGDRTVLLVHGWAGRGLQLGAFAAPLVAAGFRVFAYDGPGHGEAAGWQSSLPELADAIASITKFTGPLHGVIAHSLGSTAAILAQARGQLETKLFVAISPPAQLGSIGRRFAAVSGFSTAVVERMRQRIEQRFGFVWRDIEPVSLAASMTTHLLVVHDHDDHDISYSEGAILAAAWPQARIFSTSGLGHRHILRDAKVLDEVTRALVHTQPKRYPVEAA